VNQALNIKSSTTRDRVSVIDVIAHDSKTDAVVLVMHQPNAWDGSDAQLLELQERLNAYVSFLIDGELAEAHPELAGKHARIEVRCAHMPDVRAIDLLGAVRDQLAFQEIELEVIVSNDERRMTNVEAMTKPNDEKK
jgi:hypothetical protein